jgi:hypothetical protein
MDTSTSLVGLLGLGFGIGLKHALDADHLAAVATIVGRNHGFRRASLIGAVWGLGHTAALLAAGLLVLLLDLSISERVGAALELLVAVMLGWLGFRLIDSVLRGDTIHGHWHSHGALRHRHPHAHRHSHSPGDAACVPGSSATASQATPSVPNAHDAAAREISHDHLPSTGLRPFLVGLVHGVAGSAGLLLLVLATVPDRATGLLFILVFGIGSIGGMCAMSALLSLPFAGAARWSSRLLRPVQLGAAVFSIAVAWSIVHEFLGGLAR